MDLGIRSSQLKKAPRNSKKLVTAEKTPARLATGSIAISPAGETPFRRQGVSSPGTGENGGGVAVIVCENNQTVDISNIDRLILRPHPNPNSANANPNYTSREPWWNFNVNLACSKTKSVAISLDIGATEYKGVIVEQSSSGVPITESVLARNARNTSYEGELRLTDNGDGSFDLPLSKNNLFWFGTEIVDDPVPNYGRYGNITYTIPCFKGPISEGVHYEFYPRNLNEYFAELASKFTYPENILFSERYYTGKILGRNPNTGISAIRLLPEFFENLVDMTFTNGTHEDGTYHTMRDKFGLKISDLGYAFCERFAISVTINLNGSQIRSLSLKDSGKKTDFFRLNYYASTNSYTVGVLP